jgi:hypothetical protein
MVFPDLSDLRNGDDLRVVVPFSDAECNLSCGNAGTNFIGDSSDFAASERLPSNVPCATADDGIHLAAAVNPSFESTDDPSVYVGRIDHYEGTISFSDVCNDRSEIALSFDVKF